MVLSPYFISLEIPSGSRLWSRTRFSGAYSDYGEFLANPDAHSHGLKDAMVKLPNLESIILVTEKLALP